MGTCMLAGRSTTKARCGCVKALESALANGGKLPVNVRVIIEGEEEVGGEGIAAFVREHSDQLSRRRTGFGYRDVCAGPADVVRWAARDDLHGA